jgi:rare lipoprotein A
MRLKTVVGIMFACLVGATSSSAHADWREDILGNRMGSPGGFGNWGASQPSTPSRQKTVKATRNVAAYSGSSYSSTSAARPTRQSVTSYSSQSYSGGGGGATSSGQASYYWQPQKLASGGTFNPSAMTAAHKTLPFGTKVRVTNQRNGQSVVVTINDRGPYVAGRIIDLSSGAAGVIGMKQAGVVPVKVAVLGK